MKNLETKNFKSNGLPRVGVLFTMASLYREHKPDLPDQLFAIWKNAFDQVLSQASFPCSYSPICTKQEIVKAVITMQKSGCEALFIIPMAYTPSQITAEALKDVDLPLVLVSSATDSTLDYHIDGFGLLSNQSMHGVQDIANVLWRRGLKFDMIAGHPEQNTFKREIKKTLDVIRASILLKKGKVGRIGGWFDGMLDFTYKMKNGPGFKVCEINPEKLVSYADNISEEKIEIKRKQIEDTFQTDADLTMAELDESIKYSLALKQLYSEENLFAAGMNFKNVVEAGARTLPFLGASALMGEGFGYAGEGDILTASLCGASAQIFGQSTFTEMFCPDYQKQQILLSHMGECNYKMARTDRPVKLMPRPFDWGNCQRPAVPIFQLKPGNVTLASLTETPQTASGHDFRLVAANAEVLDAPDHPNLRNPHTRIKVNENLSDFLVNYSKAGGTHHLVLNYGNNIDALEKLAVFMNYEFVAI